MVPDLPVDLTPLLQVIDDACRGAALPPLLMLVGTLDAMRERCRRAITLHMGQREEPSQGKLWPDPGTGKVRDRWITAKDASSRLGISLRTMRRRAMSPAYAAFCIPQPRGFKVSESRLDEFMRRAR